MPETKRPLKVFLCHAHDDKLKTRELYRYLRKRGIQPWLDSEDLVGGQDWRVEIPRAIKASDAIIICLSKNSINKEGFVQAEITFALEKALVIPPGRIFIIPARFEDCEVPDNLERFHWVDLFEEGGFPRLMKSLRTRAGQLERSTVQVPQPDESSPNLNSASEEKIESEAVEKTAREKAEKETAEKERLKAEELAKQKTAKEKVEREAAEKVAREKAEKEAAEKARLKAEELTRQKVARKKAERQAAQKVAITKLFSNAAPVLRVIGILGIIIVLFWAGSWAVPKFIALVPVPQATANQSPVAKATSTNSPLPPTKTLYPTITPTVSPTFTVLPTLGVGSTQISSADGMVLQYVPSGTFQMGISDGYTHCRNYSTKLPSEYCNTWSDNSSPVSSVLLDAYWIDKTEITNAMYDKCVHSGICRSPELVKSATRSNYYGNYDYQNYPVIYVSWNEAKTYCEWAGRRLPTEAEWERAASGGKGYYPWGDAHPADDLMNFNNNIGDTTAVGSYPKGVSPVGALDMAGNVWEWVSDWYDEGSLRVLKGGSWSNNDNIFPIRVVHSYASGINQLLRDNYNPKVTTEYPGTEILARSSFQYWSSPTARYSFVGFRCANDANP